MQKKRKCPCRAVAPSASIRQRLLSRGDGPRRPASHSGFHFSNSALQLWTPGNPATCIRAGMGRVQGLGGHGKSSGSRGKHWKGEARRGPPQAHQPQGHRPQGEAPPPRRTARGAASPLSARAFAVVTATGSFLRLVAHRTPWAGLPRRLRCGGAGRGCRSMGGRLGSPVQMASQSMKAAAQRGGPSGGRRPLVLPHKAQWGHEVALWADPWHCDWRALLAPAHRKLLARRLRSPHLLPPTGW
ncbi:Hypothetical predicted protein [Marmota monax]|uniref:Uncharacterized protein n=1 Tax=Marmota monax TaxID=9995 RepID=A0A5E4A5Z9_MARMO|nr:Hypothetical predicted protein [Marmota monax]